MGYDWSIIIQAEFSIKRFYVLIVKQKFVFIDMFWFWLNIMTVYRMARYYLHYQLHIFIKSKPMELYVG